MPSFHTARSRFVQRVAPVLLTALFFFALFFHKLPFSRKLDSTVRKRRRRGGSTLPLQGDGDGVEPGIVGNFSRYLQLTSNNRRCPKWIYHKSVNFRKDAATRRYVSLSLQHSSITADNSRCANSGRLLLLHKDYMPLAEVVTRLHKAVSSYRLSIMFARHLSKFRDDYFASVFSDTRICGGFVFEKGSFVVFGKTSADAAGKGGVAKYTRVMLIASRKRICMYTAPEEGATSRTNRKEQDTLMVSKKQVDILASMISLVPFPASSAEMPTATIEASGTVSDRIQAGREGLFIESTGAAFPVASILPLRSKSVEVTVSFPSKFPMSSSPSQRPFGLEPARISFGVGSSDTSFESDSVVSASKASRIPEFYFSTLPPALLPSGSFGLPSPFAIPSASARFSRASFSPNRNVSIFASVLPRASANTTSSTSVGNSVDQSPLFSGSVMSILPLESQKVFESPVVSSMQSVSVGSFSSQLPTYTPLMSFSESTLPQGRMPSESPGTSAEVMPDASSTPNLAPSRSSGVSRPAPTITPSASFSMTAFLPSPGLSPSLTLSPSKSPFVQPLSQSPAVAKGKDLPLTSPSFFMTPSATRSLTANPSMWESPQIETSIAYSPHLIPAFPRELPGPSPPLSSESSTGSMSPSRSMFPSASISASSSMSSSFSVSPSRSISASSSVSSSLSVSPSRSMSASSSMSTSLSVSPSHSMSPSTSYKAASSMPPSHSILASLSVSPTITRTPSPSMSLHKASSSASVSKQSPQSSLSVVPSGSPRATPSVKMSSVPEFSSETDLLSSEPEISGKSFDLSKVSQSQTVMESTFPMPSMFASASIKPRPATPTPAGPVRVKHPSPSSSNPVVGIKRDIAETRSSCFSRFAEVSMANGDLKRMEKLRIGDIVQIGMGKTGKIYGFSHLHREVRALFSKVETANRSLTATPSHHVLTDRGFVAAGSIRKGYNLILNNGQTAPVLSVSTEISKGLYNPHTFDGTIVVDGFICSTYTSTIQLFAAHSLLAPFRFLHHSGFRLDALRWLLDVTGAHTIVRVLSALLTRFSA